MKNPSGRTVFEATLCASRRANADTLLLELETGGLDLEPEPGQFVQVDVSESLTLPRPFSIAGARPGAVELLVEIRGRGTRELARLGPGDGLRMLGPLGRGFTVPDGLERAVVVAGGIGVAGVRLLVSRLAACRARVDVIVGARSAGNLLHDELDLPAGDEARVLLATDDGSGGARGTACDLFETILPELGRNDAVYACGPLAMLAALAATTARAGVPCQISLEEVMACGVGACRGCVVETRSGYRSVCSDGPVFDAAEIVFEGGTV